MRGKQMLERTGVGVVAAVAALLAVAPAAGAADWPFYGKDLANSRDGGSGGPSAADVASLQQAWRFDTPDGDFTGTPAVAGGTVVAGSGGGSIVALDSLTGKTRWTRDVNQPINGSAAIDAGAGLVYVPIAKKNAPHLLALGLSDGAVAWDRTLTTQNGSDVFGSPVLWKGDVYMGTSADNGDDSTMRGAVLALDGKTGAVKWETFMVPPGSDGGAVWSTPAIDTETGRLFVGTGNAYHAPATDMTDAIVALDARSGAVLAHFQATPDDVFSSADNPAGPDSDFGASPNLLTGPDGRKLVGEGQKSGIYWAFDRTTLQPVWKTTVGPSSPAGGVIGSTAFDGNRIFGPNTPGGEVWALDRGGAISWLSNDPGPADFSSVEVANGVVYNSDLTGVVNARDASTGLVLNKLPVGSPSFGGVAVVGKAVFTVVGTSMSSSGSIVAFGDTSGSAAAPGQGGGGATPARPRLRLSVTPRRVRVGRRVAFRFRVRSGSRPVVGATVRFAGKRATTNTTGRARIVAVMHRTGGHRARAGRFGYRTAGATVRALRRLR
jgi:polyvinyl alcohol dehydrogenase (cytochrome)